MPTKTEIRRCVRELKSQRNAEQLHELSVAISAKLLTTEAWKSSDVVLLYHALPDEVNLFVLLKEGVKTGKTLLLPVVQGDDLVLRCYEGEESLAAGAYGIMEPVGEIFPRERYREIQLALIPGMAFDREGHRVGRGKGYYDRLLPHLLHTYRLGVCFPFQMFDSVPCEEHDVRMDEVIWQSGDNSCECL